MRSFLCSCPHFCLCPAPNILYILMDTPAQWLNPLSSALLSEWSVFFRCEISVWKELFEAQEWAESGADTLMTSDGGDLCKRKKLFRKEVSEVSEFTHYPSLIQWEAGILTYSTLWMFLSELVHMCCWNLMWDYFYLMLEGKHTMFTQLKRIKDERLQRRRVR